MTGTLPWDPKDYQAGDIQHIDTVPGHPIFRRRIMNPSDRKQDGDTQNPPRHTPGETKGNRKGLNDTHASHRDPTEGASQGEKSNESEWSGDDMPIPTFDEGERRPTPIESTANDGVRTPVQGSPAGQKVKNTGDKGKHTEATMPPGEGQDPKRNTM